MWPYRNSQKKFRSSRCSRSSVPGTPLFRVDPYKRKKNWLFQFFKRYSCDQCDYKATHKGSLKRHIESVHGDKQYPCDKCDYKTAWKGNLKTHIDSVHGDVRYTCDQCDNKATQKGDVKRHIEYIHGDVRYTCDQCDYNLKRNHDLKTHMNSVHGDVWYTCDKCSSDIALSSSSRIAQIITESDTNNIWVGPSSIRSVCHKDQPINTVKTWSGFSCHPILRGVNNCPKVDY